MKKLSTGEEWVVETVLAPATIRYNLLFSNFTGCFACWVFLCYCSFGVMKREIKQPTRFLSASQVLNFQKYEIPFYERLLYDFTCFLLNKVSIMSMSLFLFYVLCFSFLLVCVVYFIYLLKFLQSCLYFVFF